MSLPPNKLIAGTSAEFPEGQIVSRSFGAHDLIFIRRNGSVLAFKDLCTHQPVKLSEFGEVLGGRLICHAHGGTFDIDRGGAVVLDPPCEGLCAYKCEESSGQVTVFI